MSIESFACSATQTSNESYILGVVVGDSLRAERLWLWESCFSCLHPHPPLVLETLYGRAFSLVPVPVWEIYPCRKPGTLSLLQTASIFKFDQTYIKKIIIFMMCNKYRLITIGTYFHNKFI